MCSSPHWQVGQSLGRSWFSEKLSPANGNKGYIAVSRFREKMFPANWVQRVTAISRKISRSWVPKNGVQHATAIYTTAIYRAYTVPATPGTHLKISNEYKHQWWDLFPVLWETGTHFKDHGLWVPGTHKEVNNFESLRLKMIFGSKSLMKRGFYLKSGMDFVI